MKSVVILALVTSTAALVARARAADATRPSAAPKAFAPVGNPAHLHNAHRVTDHLLSGAQPEGEAAFRELAALGVKTIISVDGAAPDVELARRYGLRYVHLPITYSGVTADEGKRIAKAIDELPGPIYLHCHHGKHRSAAAVAVACVMNGRLSTAQAEDVLKTFGTGVNYKGLWRDARDARPLERHVLDDLTVEYVERAKIPPVAEAMVLVDQTLENLKAAQRAGWRAPADHPDLDPPHEALQLREHLHELGRVPDTARRPADYQRLMRESEAAAQRLEDALRGWKPLAAAAAAAPATMDLAMKAVTTSCADCHKAHRD